MRAISPWSNEGTDNHLRAESAYFPSHTQLNIVIHSEKGHSVITGDHQSRLYRERFHRYI